MTGFERFVSGENATLFQRACMMFTEAPAGRLGRGRDQAVPGIIAGLMRLAESLPNRNSLMTKVLLAGAVFVLVPLIIYGRLGDAERAKSELLFQVAQEQGRLITTHLAPLFRDGVKSVPQIDRSLESLANENLNIRILFKPAAVRIDSGFYYVAASPPLDGQYLQSEIGKLASLGILSRLAASCNTHETVGTRHSLADGPQHLITAVIPFATESGCWSVVTSYAGEAFLGSSFGRPYWQSPEIQFASVLYFSAAFLTILILLRIRNGLRAFRDTAMSLGRRSGSGSFAATIENPDLTAVAEEFDRMLDRIGLLSFAVERSPIAVSVASREWLVEYVNPAWQNLSGRNRDELLGQDLRRKAFQSQSDLPWDEICAQVAAGGTWHGQIQRRMADGRILWAEVSLYRLAGADRSTEHFVCLQEDITERQQMLNRLVTEKEKAQALNRMKSNFVAHMSHEFRTPLNAILGFSEVIATEAFGPAGMPRYVEYAGHIHNSGQHLLSLINDILDLSKLESGKETLQLEPLDLAEIIDDMVQMIGPQAAAGDVALVVEQRVTGKRVLGDERAIKQVLLNLLSNAVKFTPAQGRVTVTAVMRADGRVRLAVTDTGCGIAAAEIPKICEPYARADNPETRNTAGTGLGLPIVKRLVELQNGSFNITSTLGEGTTVEVILPATAG